MKTAVTIWSYPTGRKKAFIAEGRASDVSDKIIRIKRAFGFRIGHGTQRID